MKNQIKTQPATTGLKGKTSRRSRYFSVGSGLAPSSMFAAMSVAAALVVATPLASLGKTIVVPSGSIVTIQDGVDAAAPGDTIKVLPGTYASGVVVATPRLKLKAETKTGPVIVCCGEATGFTIVADQVEIEGFDIGFGSIVTGINVDGAHQVVIKNNHVVARRAILVTGADRVRVSGNTGGGRNGISVVDSSNVRIEHNTIEAMLTAIEVHNSSGTHVDHNEASGEDAISIGGCTGTHFDHNFVSAGRDGIHVGDSIGTHVAHNLVEAHTGILVSSSSAGRIAHNTLTGSGRGIQVSADSCGNEFKNNSALAAQFGLESFEDPAAPCNSYKNNEAETAFPSLEFWDVK